MLHFKILLILIVNIDDFAGNKKTIPAKENVKVTYAQD